jgi:hypothetical protein
MGKKMGQALGAHICNPSYSGDRDQLDLGSRPTWANKETPSQPIKIWAWWFRPFIPSPVVKRIDSQVSQGINSRHYSKRN